VVFSPEPHNLRCLTQLSQNADLANHVKTLYLDTTTYYDIGVGVYAEIASRYFASVFGLGPQHDGPLSAARLLQVLQSDPFKPIAAACLSGPARGAFHTGYTLYCARCHHAKELSKGDGYYKLLRRFTEKFSAIKRMETCTYWAETDVDYRKEFECFLRLTLPARTLRQISGLSSYEKIKGKRAMSPSAFNAPGPAARDLNVMFLPPMHDIDPICHGRVARQLAHRHGEQSHNLIYGALRALRFNKIKLESLSLPGQDSLGQNKLPRQRNGAVNVQTLCLEANTRGPGESLLLPVLGLLKKLELCLDFMRPAFPPPLVNSGPPMSICKAIQKMRSLECLGLGIPDSNVELYGVWDLSSFLLFKKEDYPTAPPESDTDDLDLGFGSLNDFINVVMGSNGGVPNPTLTTGQPFNLSVDPTAFGKINLSADGTPVQPPASFPAPNTSAQHNATGNVGAAAGDGSAAAHSQPAQPMSLGPQPLQYAALGGIIVPAPLPLQSDTSEGDGIPDTPLIPNPWPKLKSLSLWNLVARPAELKRLSRTVATSLRTLSLSNVHVLVKDDGPSISHPHPGVQSDGPDSFYNEDELPDLIDTLSTEPGARSDSSVPLPMSPWLPVIEALAEDLRLKTCDIALCPDDAQKLRDSLSKEIIDMDMLNSVERTISDYLTQGDGMGLPLFVANAIQHASARSKGKGKCTDQGGTQDLPKSYDGVEEKHDLDEPSELPSAKITSELMDRMRELEMSRALLHVCSEWQACPEW
jgi:hypothetical protein